MTDFEYFFIDLSVYICPAYFLKCFFPSLIFSYSVCLLLSYLSSLLVSIFSHSGSCFLMLYIFPLTTYKLFSLVSSVIELFSCSISLRPHIYVFSLSWADVWCGSWTSETLPCRCHTVPFHFVRLRQYFSPSLPFCAQIAHIFCQGLWGYMIFWC